MRACHEIKPRDCDRFLKGGSRSVYKLRAYYKTYRDMGLLAMDAAVGYRE